MLLKYAANLQKPGFVVVRTQNIAANATVQGGMDEVNFGGGNFGNDAYMANASVVGIGAGKTNNISRSCRFFAHLNPVFEISGGRRAQGDSQGMLVAVHDESTAVKSTRFFAGIAVRRSHLGFCGA